MISSTVLHSYLFERFIRYSKTFVTGKLCTTLPLLAASLHQAKETIIGIDKWERYAALYRTALELTECKANRMTKMDNFVAKNFF